MNRSERRKKAGGKGASKPARGIEAHLERARGALLAGRLDDAVALCDAVLAKQRANPEALHIKGLALRAQNHPDGAIDHLSRAAKADPGRADIHYNLGITLASAGRLADAEAAYRRAIGLDGGNPDYHNNLGSLLNRLDRAEDALQCFERALDLDENHVQARNNLGTALLELKRPENAIAQLEAAIRLAPDYADAHGNLGNAYVAAGDAKRGIDAYNDAIKFRPGAAVFHFNLGNALLDTGSASEAVQAYRHALALQPERAEMRSNYLYSLQFEPGVTSAKLAAAQEEWNARHGRDAPAARFDGARFDPERRLRLGFLSSDLGLHPVGYFLIPVLENLASSGAEIFCYSNRQAPDAMTERLRTASDHWAEVRPLGNQELAERIAGDGIDILFEISGHARGNRLAVYAMRPAPLQISWGIGYPGATGLDAIDALLTDERHIPPGDEANFKERLIHMRHGQFCFDAPKDAPDVGPLPAEENGFLTFGCLNQPRKITAAVLEAWAAILGQVPGSKLLLGYEGMDDQANAARITEALGVAPERLTILGGASHGDFLGRYNRIDIGLDTFPYSGGLTTLEALWMGVPVLTFPGESPAGRHAAGHLWTIGHGQFIAGDVGGYIKLAAELAGDADRLARLRSGLRATVAASPLSDGPGFADDFLSAVRQLWRQRCQQG